jgi:hypothetical protein
MRTRLKISMILTIIIVAMGCKNSFAQINFVKYWQDTMPANSWKVVLGDVDDDGDADAFVANDLTDGVSNILLLNDGNGNFDETGQNFIDGATGADMGDINKDGYLDICYIDMTGMIKIWLNNGQGQFHDSGLNLATESGIEDIHLGYLNDDDLPDIIIANSEDPDEIYFNNGDTTFTKSAQTIGSSLWTGGIGLADLNNDSFTDIFTGYWGSPAKVWINDGAGTFTSTSQNIGPGNDCHVHGVTPGDLNGDSFIDIFLALSCTAVAGQVWLNDGTGMFTLYQTITLSSSNYNQDVVLADFDNDGDLDAYFSVLSDENKPLGFKILLNNGSGSYTDSGITIDGNNSMAAAAGDLNGDNKTDLFVTLNTWGENTTVYNAVWINETIIGVNEEAPFKTLNKVHTYPNPFTSSTTIHYSIEAPSHVKLKIFDINGSEIRMVENNYKDIGEYTVAWDATDNNNRFVSDGIYFCYIETENSIIQRTMMVLIR